MLLFFKKRGFEIIGARDTFRGNSELILFFEKLENYDRFTDRPFLRTTSQTIPSQINLTDILIFTCDHFWISNSNSENRSLIEKGKQNMGMQCGLNHTLLMQGNVGCLRVSYMNYTFQLINCCLVFWSINVTKSLHWRLKMIRTIRKILIYQTGYWSLFLLLILFIKHYNAKPKLCTNFWYYKSLKILHFFADIITFSQILRISIII